MSSVNVNAGLQETHLDPALKRMFPVFGPFSASDPCQGLGLDLALVDEIWAEW